LGDVFSEPCVQEKRSKMAHGMNTMSHMRNSARLGVARLCA
jgi:hypothetical protein